MLSMPISSRLSKKSSTVASARLSTTDLTCSKSRSGYEQGEQHADRVLAARIQDRLIDHPDAWDNIDGDFLEVEGALNSVRDSERKVQQALRDESHRKDDLVTYLAHDLRTPLASVVGYLSLLQEAP